eukprot:7024886-Pyramimonas_sp.AAC.1
MGKRANTAAHGRSAGRAPTGRRGGRKGQAGRQGRNAIRRPGIHIVSASPEVVVACVLPTPSLVLREQLASASEIETNQFWIPVREPPALQFKHGPAYGK